MMDARLSVKRLSQGHQGFINPRPEGYGSLFCVSFILSSGTAFTSTTQLRHERDRHVKILRFDSWILLKRWRSRVMAGSLAVMAVQLTAILLGHAQLFNNSCLTHDRAQRAALTSSASYTG